MKQSGLRSLDHLCGCGLLTFAAPKFMTFETFRVVSAAVFPWQESIDFVYSPQGAGLFFPEAYESFVKALPYDERSNLIASYAKRLDSPDKEVGIGKTIASFCCGPE